jgi:hypothetical protein
MEESGVESAHLVRSLGTCWFVAPEGVVPAGKEEQVHHAFHLHLNERSEQETWEWSECSDGTVPLHPFVFRWVDLREANRLLHPIQAMWLTSLGSSLGRM